MIPSYVKKKHFGLRNAIWAKRVKTCNMKTMIRRQVAERQRLAVYKEGTRTGDDETLRQIPTMHATDNNLSTKRKFLTIVCRHQRF